MHSPARGFTLIELLVVMVLAGIVVAMVTISSAPNAKRALRQQAEQLAQLFIAAQDEAFLTGRPILWETDERGFRFAVRRDGAWEQPDNDLLRGRAWSVPVTRVTLDGDRAPRLLFTRELMAAPVSLTLVQDGMAVTLRADVLGRFEVEE